MAEFTKQDLAALNRYAMRRAKELYREQIRIGEEYQQKQQKISRKSRCIAHVVVVALIFAQTLVLYGAMMIILLLRDAGILGTGLHLGLRALWLICAIGLSCWAIFEQKKNFRKEREHNDWQYQHQMKAIEEQLDEVRSYLEERDKVEEVGEEID